MRSQHPSSVVVAASLAAFSATMIQSMVVPLLPTLSRELDAPISDVSWVVTVTLLAGVAASAAVGPLGNRYGVRRVFLALQLVAAMGSVLALLPLGLGALIAARGLQGVGLAAIPISMTILRVQLPAKDVPKGVAATSAMVMVGGVSGTLLSAGVATLFGWHAVFFTSLVLAVVVAILGVLVVRPSPPTVRAPFDIGGVALLPISVALVLVALLKGPQWGLTPLTVTVFAAGVAALFGWRLVESRVRTPVFPLRLVFSPSMLPIHVAALAAGFAMYSTVLAVPQLLQSPLAFGLGILPAAFLTIPSVVAGVIGAAVSARVTMVRGPRVTVVVGSIFACLGLVVLSVSFGSIAGIIVANVISGFGASMAYATIPLLIMQRTTLAETGAANSINTVSRSIGNATSSAAFATLMVLLPSIESSAPSGDAFRVFVIAGAVAAATISVAALGSKSTAV